MLGGKGVAFLWDGKIYDVEEGNTSHNGYHYVYYGNAYLLGISDQDTGLPFCVRVLIGDYIEVVGIEVYARTQGSHTIALYAKSSVVKTIDEKYLPDSVKNENIVHLQSDWNQSDEWSDDYIKNRPFYEETIDTGDVETLYEESYTFSAMFTLPETIYNDVLYVTFNQENYTLTRHDVNPITWSYYSTDGTELPFSLYYDGLENEMYFDLFGYEFTTDKVDVLIQAPVIETNIVQLNEKFIPDTIARSSDLESLSDKLDYHSDVEDVHMTDERKTQLTNAYTHSTNSNIHITSEEKAALLSHKDDVDNPHQILEKIEENSDLVVTELGDEIVGDSPELDPVVESRISEIETEVSSLKSDLEKKANADAVPTKTSQLQNDSNFLTSVPSEYAKASDIPTKTSQLTNDSGFLTSIPFISTFEELKTATLEDVTPIILEHGVTIEVSETLTFHEGTTLIGNGATIKRASGHENKLIYLHRNCRVQDLVIDGNRSAMVSPTWQNTADIATSTGCVIDNVTINEGNEAICVYGDNCVITNCNINNCGGNGIHFSGSNNTRVENCRVINANLRSGMGHEDGCIIWSNECDHIVCSNNWCEGGIAGFGSIDAAFNSHVKLIGNTVKDCTVAIDLAYQEKAPHDLIISNNTFINSGKIDLYKTNSQIYVAGHIVIDGNLFVDTDASFVHVTDVSMTGNIFKNGCPSFTRCARVTIANNTVNNARDTAKNGIFANKCLNVVVEGNYVRAHKDVLNVGYSTGVTVRGNNIRNVYSPSNTDYCINCNSVSNLIFDGNIVVLYRRGLTIPSYATIINNVILCATTNFNSLMLSDSRTNVLIRNNRINGGKSFATVTTNVIENNDIGANDDVFVSVTKTLTNLTADTPAKATKGDEFAFTIIPNEGCTLPDTISIKNNGITMDVNEYEYNNTTGEVIIHCVCGDIVITAVADGNGGNSGNSGTTTNYTNLVPTSIDTDGSVFNSTGYQDGLRLTYEGTTTSHDCSTVTGFIPVKAGDIVRIAGVEWYSSGVNFVCAYDSSFNILTNLYNTFKTTSDSCAFDGNNCSVFNDTDALIKIGDKDFSNAANKIAYIRVSSAGTQTSQNNGLRQLGANMIVTVNEEIA